MLPLLFTFALNASAANTTPILMKSAELCFGRSIAASTSQWLPSACHNGALISWSAKNSYIQIVFENTDHKLRAYALHPTKELEMNGLTLSGPAFEANCGGNLSLRALSAPTLRFEIANRGEPLRANEISLKNAVVKIAGDMKEALLQQVQEQPQAYADNDIKACYSSLMATIGNAGLTSLLSKKEKKILDDAIFPTAGSELQENSTVR